MVRRYLIDSRLQPARHNRKQFGIDNGLTGRVEQFDRIIIKRTVSGYLEYEPILRIIQYITCHSAYRNVWCILEAITLEDELCRRLRRDNISHLVGEDRIQTGHINETAVKAVRISYTRNRIRQRGQAIALIGHPDALGAIQATGR